MSSVLSSSDKSASACSPRSSIAAFRLILTLPRSSINALMPVFFLSTGLRTEWGMGGASVLAAAALLLFGWLVFGVRDRRNRFSRRLDDTETDQLAELNRLAEAMAERIKNLETILDAENPEWREYDEKNQK